MLFLTACQKLDTEIITDLNKDHAETIYANLNGLLTGVYVELQEGFVPIDNAMMASSTDEAEHAVETSTIHNLNNGIWNAISNPNNVWGSYFRGIRKANVLLGSTGRINLDVNKLNPSPSSQALYNQQLADIKRWTYEARFLRAFFLF